MISKREITFTETKTIVDFIKCDICGTTCHTNTSNEDGSINMDDYTEELLASNFIHIYKSFGYGSRIGDGEELYMDVCENCFIKAFGMDKILSCCREE
jgi:hypothetical protein